MIKFSIKYLESISGIKAHTIRIWEKRYKLLEPKRTKSNIRYYSNDDLRKILNIVSLLDDGYKISEIGKLTNDQINKELTKTFSGGDTPNRQYQRLTNDVIVASANFDRVAFEKVFNTGVSKFGFSNTLEHILYPALERTGVLWQAEEINPVHEHFFSNLLKQKLFIAIDSISQPSKATRKCILFLPENEEHEIGLLYLNYLMLSAGIQTYYIGQRTPLESLVDAEDVIKATHLAFFITTVTATPQANTFLKNVRRLFPKREVLIGGNPQYIRQLSLPKSFIFLDSPLAAREYLSRYK
jgi:DNA-binding transcriptional MerR regulator